MSQIFVFYRFVPFSEVARGSHALKEFVPLSEADVVETLNTQPSTFLLRDFYDEGGCIIATAFSTAFYQASRPENVRTTSIYF